MNCINARHINISLVVAFLLHLDYAHEIHSETVDAVRFYFNASETEITVQCTPIENGVFRVDFHLVVCIDQVLYM